MTETPNVITVERLAAPEADDLVAISALESDSFSNPWPPDALAVMLRSDVTRLYVARGPSGRVVGFCACWLIAGELHINSVAVERGLRRQRIATRLLRHVLASTGATRATLEVRRSNTAALRLYESLGFRTSDVRPDYYTNPDEDGLILWLNP